MNVFIFIYIHTNFRREYYPIATRFALYGRQISVLGSFKGEHRSQLLLQKAKEPSDACHTPKAPAPIIPKSLFKFI